jgi:outer membrane protein assembly factor BamB
MDIVLVQNGVATLTPSKLARIASIRLLRWSNHRRESAKPALTAGGSMPNAPTIWTAPALAVGAILTSLAFATDWPQWRGPNADGISTETAWDPAALAAGPTVLWQVNVGAGHSSVSVRSTRLYTMGNQSNEDLICCLDAASGKEVWRSGYPSNPGDYGGPRATPVLHGDRVYAVGRWGHALCLDAEDGGIRWWKDLTKLGAHLPTWGISGSPVVHGDAVIFNAATHGIALDAATGDTVWASPTGTGGYASPVLLQRGGRACAAIFSKEALALIDAATGTSLLSHPWRTSYDVNAADPVVSGGSVFLSSGYGSGCALLDLSGSKPVEVWRNTKMRNHFSSSVLIDGHIYGIDGNTGTGALTCLRLSDGELVWRQKGGFEALTAATGRLIAIDKQGDLIIAAATPAAYNEIARAHVLPTKGAKCWTAPVLSNGRIYCRNSLGDLVCVDVRSKG